MLEGQFEKGCLLSQRKQSESFLGSTACLAL
jgi:hypothetical protein